MNYFAVILGIFVWLLIGNSLAYCISNKKRRKKNDGGSCCVCKYHALTLMEKLEADYYEGFNDAAQLIMATLKVVNGIKQQIENLE